MESKSQLSKLNPLRKWRFSSDFVEVEVATLDGPLGITILAEFFELLAARGGFCSETEAFDLPLGGSFGIAGGGKCRASGFLTEIFCSTVRRFLLTDLAALGGSG